MSIVGKRPETASGVSNSRGSKPTWKDSPESDFNRPKFFLNQKDVSWWWRHDGRTANILQTETDARQNSWKQFNIYKIHIRSVRTFQINSFVSNCVNSQKLYTPVSGVKIQSSNITTSGINLIKHQKYKLVFERPEMTSTKSSINNTQDK